MTGTSHEAAATAPGQPPHRCSLVSPQDYGCWLQQGHAGKCEPDASRLGAVSGTGPSCTRCGQPLIRWPSAQWADTGGMVVCQVSPGRYAAHDVHNAAVTAEQPTRARLTPAATSPGRLAFEAWAEAEGRLTEWHEDLDDHARAAWEFAAQAACAGLLAERDSLRASLDTLTDRAEAGGVITGDEADEYRKLTGQED